MVDCIRLKRVLMIAMMIFSYFQSSFPAFATGVSEDAEFTHPLKFYQNLSLDDVANLTRKASAVVEASPVIVRPYVCAVLPFANTSGNLEHAWLSAGIMNLFMTELAESPAFAILDRSRIEDCLKEIEFSLSGLVDSERALKAGAFLAADLLLVGDFQILGETVLINARLVDTTTMEVRYAGNATAGLDASLFRAQKGISRAMKSRIGGTDAPETVRPWREVPLDALREYELAHAEYESGNLSSAVSRLRSLLKRLPRYAQARIELALILQYTDKNSEARDLLLKAIAEEKKSKDADRGVLARYHLQLANVEMSIARQVDLKGGREERIARAASAEKALRDAIKYVARMSDAERSSMQASVLQRLAVLEDLRIDFLKEAPRPLGRAYSYSALELMLPLFEYESDNIQGVLILIGKTYINENRHSEAQAFLGEVQRVLRDGGRTNARSYNVALQFLGLSYFKQGDKGNARTFLSESYEIKMRLYGPGASDTVRVKKMLDSLSN